MQVGVFALGLSFIVHIKYDKDTPSSARWSRKGRGRGKGRGLFGGDEGMRETGNQPWSSSKHVSQTRTGFLEDGVRAFLDEHSAQKMFPQCLQWCWIFTEEKERGGACYKVNY